MTSLLPPPGVKARSRKDLSAGSIPTLVEEEHNYSPPRLAVNGNGHGASTDARKYSDSSLPSATAYTNITVTQKPVKASRRSSLGLGLLGAKSDTNKVGKRRSSIAVVLLGRRNSKVCTQTVAASVDLDFQPKTFHVTSQSKEPVTEKAEKYQRKSSESDTENDPPVTITITEPGCEPAAHEKKRRRSSSWATKMERRRRKGLPAMNGEIDYNGAANGYGDVYTRQKRHSWWNIFVPENLKNR